MSTNNSIVLSYHESLLRESDVDLLRGPYWLNDQIISFYLEYLEKDVYASEKDFLFVSPEVTQCIKIVAKNEIETFLGPLDATEKQFIFFPLNNNENDRAGGSHWSLLLFSRPDRSFFHFDSMKGINSGNCQHFVGHICEALGAVNASFENVTCLQQSNNYDCGIHVICMVELLTKHIIRTGNAVDAPILKSMIVRTKRNEILDMIIDLGGTVE